MTRYEPEKRFLTTPEGKPGFNYLCKGWNTFFRHIDHPLKILGWLMKRGYPAPELMRTRAIEDAFARAGRKNPASAAAGSSSNAVTVARKEGPEKRDRKRGTGTGKAWGSAAVRIFCTFLKGMERG